MIKEPDSTGPLLACRSRSIGILAAGLAFTFVLTAHAQSQTSAERARLAISIDASGKALSSDRSTDFVIRVSNSGGSVTSAERVVMAMPSGLRSLDWTCSAHDGSRCAAASGSGPLDVSLSGLRTNSRSSLLFTPLRIQQRPHLSRSPRTLRCQESLAARLANPPLAAHSCVSRPVRMSGSM